MIAIIQQIGDRLQDSRQRRTKIKDTPPTESKEFAYTFIGSSPDLLAKRKKPVSIPNVSSTSIKAVNA